MLYSALRLPDGQATHEAVAAESSSGMDTDEVVRRLWIALDPTDRHPLIKDFVRTSTADVRFLAALISERLAAGGPAAAADAGDDLPSSVVYACAARALQDGRVAEAAVGLAALLGSEEARGRGLLGLAVCAACFDRFDDALELALASRDAGNRHPRVYYLAGWAELKRGNKRVAQVFLARASRIARRDDDQLEDLQMAQRLLLQMHIGASEGLNVAHA